MDPRIREHAAILVNHSTAVEPGDRVVVSVPPAAEDLAVAVYELLGERGARPVMTYAHETVLGTDRAARGYLRNAAVEDVPELDHLGALYEQADAVIRVRGPANATEHADVSPDRYAAYRRVNRDVRRTMLSKRWCLTRFPTPAGAQLAGMSTEAYENFVWDAIIKDWDAQREHQAQLAEILDGADEVHIVSGDETDLRMSVAGMCPINDDGRKNLPGGEVFTAPVPDSVEGTVRFDVPIYHQGSEVTDAYLEFEGGEVVAHSAGKNEAVLAGVLDTDEGARRLGELGVGMNRQIDRFTRNVLFDEKMGDTVHLAVGMAYPECVPDPEQLNDSAVHVDMIFDVSEDSVIEVDGEVIQRNGTFVFEEGFGGPEDSGE